MDELTPTQRLAEIDLGRPVADYIAEKRTCRPRWPWRMIAAQLHDDTQGRISVSHETVRSWYDDGVSL